MLLTRTNLFVSQVEINILTGETTILQADIIYDCGQSMNPAVDMGQVAKMDSNCSSTLKI